MLIGWATGGIVFGILGDRIGRVKTLLIMILSYSVSTGLCGLSRGQYDYILYCFITGMGAGGIFPVGCTLVAESLPDRTRAHALGMLQAFSAFGNVGAGFIWMAMIGLWSHGLVDHPWRWFFSAGILPASLSIIIVRRLREPEAWTKAVAAGKLAKKAGSLAELFGDPRWRPRAIVGMLLAASGVIGLWGIGVFSNDLTQSFIGRQYDNAHAMEGQAKQDLKFVAGLIASPEQLKSVYQAGDGKEGLRTRDLLGAEDKDLDAKALYEAAASLMLKDQTVSSATVLEWLDHSDKGRKVQPAAQTPEDRARRAELLKDPALPDSFAKNVTRIQDRQKARGITALYWAAVTLVMFNVGAFFGMYAFARITNRIGRRPTFALFFVAAGLTTAFAFLVHVEA